MKPQQPMEWKLCRPNGEFEADDRAADFYNSTQQDQIEN